MVSLDNNKTPGFLAKVFGRFSRSARSSEDDAAIPIVDENIGASVELDHPATLDDAKNALLRCLEEDEIPSSTEESSDYSLDQLADDGGTPDRAHFLARNEATESSQLGIPTLEISAGASDSTNHASEGDLIPELAAGETGEINGEIVEITDFDPERDIIGIYYTKPVDAETDRPIMERLKVAPFEDGSGKAILLDGIQVAHFVGTHCLAVRDIALIEQ